jgi:serine/threonine-protein kinase
MTPDGDRSTELPTQTANLAAHSPAGRRVLTDSSPGGFAPGALLGQRFRIIGLLGVGGMGEVYRADDLMLGQPIALKFLPSAVASDPAWRERLYSEVRMSRQVSHPNVCRVYDVGEVEGRHFLSMEYIDGEDLASLIKRIGHLPSAKVLEIAQQLCAGLAAAHQKGVLHRDLKPRNVMIDGRGYARITDFGLAVAMHRVPDSATSPGTPIYMAPEQLAGRGASIQSDLYALGLVLYELATGHQPFHARNLADLRAEKQELIPPAPSEIAREIDPRLERAIMRCLDRDPAARPGSVLQLAASLPGGDPLSAAVAAGETPSPEMVAASVSGDRLRPAQAFALVAALVVCTVLSIVLGRFAIMTRRAPLERPPDALVERARTVVDLAGFVPGGADRAWGVGYRDDFVRRLTEAVPRSWQGLSAHAVRFWYRQSERPLRRLAFSLGVSPMITMQDPPLATAGEILVVLDGAGRLMQLAALPPEPGAPVSVRAVPDWAGLFREAGLNLSDFRQVEPVRAPMFWADQRFAWARRGTGPGEALHVEAAIAGNRAVWFEVRYPWNDDAMRTAARLFYDQGFGGEPDSPGKRYANIVGIALGALALFGGLVVARRNLRLGRGDRRGATRLAVGVTVTLAISWLLDEHHVADAHEWYLVVSFAGRALVLAGIVWWTYVAFEPFVRRHWPRQLISWNRLLAGVVRDPLVGRDVLIGLAAGAAITAVLLAMSLLPGWIGLPAERMAAPTWHAWLGPRQAISLLLQILTNSLLDAFSALFIIVLTRSIFRNDWVAAAVAAALLATPDMLMSHQPAIAAVAFFLVYLFGVMLLIRVGLLAVIALRVVIDLLQAYPIVLDTSAWYASLGLSALVVLAVLTALSVRIALSGGGAAAPAR